MSDLNFQNFGMDDSPFTNPNTDRRNPSTVKDSANLVTGNIDLNDDSNTGTENKLPNAHNIFSFKYYQQFFDVDQEQVYTRLLRSLIPTPNSNFIHDHIQPIPDLYGPLWICITFVFSTAICGNLAHYIETHGQNRYENDFTLVTGATTLISSYVIFIPFILYWILWYRKSAIQYSYLELLSAYGYSLAVFVPVSVLWVIHFHWFRWILILGAIGIGGMMLYNIVWPAIRNDPNKALAFAIVGGVLFLHASLALGFKAYYFDSVIPSQHGLVPQPEIPAIPSPDNAAVQAVDVKKTEAAALIGGDNDAIKKVTERDATDPGTKLPKATDDVLPPEDAPSVTGGKKDVEKIEPNKMESEKKAEDVTKENRTVKKSEAVQIQGPATKSN